MGPEGHRDRTGSLLRRGGFERWFLGRRALWNVTCIIDESQGQGSFWAPFARANDTTPGRGPRRPSLWHSRSSPAILHQELRLLAQMRAEADMLKISISNDRQRRQLNHASGPLELGRGPVRNDAERFILEDRFVSRDQLRMEEAPDFRLKH